MIDIKKVKIALSRVSTALGGGVYREYNSSREPFEDDIATINEAIEELKRLQKFKQTFDAYELAKKQDYVAFEILKECEKELARLQNNIVLVKTVCINEGHNVFLPLIEMIEKGKQK